MALSARDDGDHAASGDARLRVPATAHHDRHRLGRRQVAGARAMASHCLENVGKRYGATTVIHGIDLDVDGRRVRRLRRSFGLRQVDAAADDRRAGTMSDQRRDRASTARVNEISAAQRGLAMVFQSYALYPHMTRLSEPRVRPREPAHAARRDRRQGARRGADARARRSCSSGDRRSSPAGSASAWRSAARSSAIRRYSCSTNRCRTSTPSCACRCAPKSPRCTSASARR